MKAYTDQNNDSNIQSYDTGESWITVTFRGRSCYTYTYRSAGLSTVEEMKRLASCGDGLNAYINKHKPKYHSKS